MGKLKITSKKGRKSAANPCEEPCPIERGMRIIGGKWKGSILWHLKDGPVRFNDLTRQLGGASKKMVNQKLKELEELKLIQRKVVATKPVGVTYSITRLGKSAVVILDLLRIWAKKHNF